MDVMDSSQNKDMYLNRKLWDTGCNFLNDLSFGRRRNTSDSVESLDKISEKKNVSWRELWHNVKPFETPLKCPMQPKPITTQVSNTQKSANSTLHDR